MNIFKKHEISKPGKTQLLLGLFLIASPWVILFFTTIFVAHHSVFESVPCWSDELSYWHETLSFCQKGFNFGYYTLNEAVPTYLSFGTHAFGTVSVYALFANIVGWKTYSIVIANAFFMSLAFFVVVLMLKPSLKIITLILFFSITYVPLILYTPTSMSELLNYSVLIIYSGMLYEYLKNGGRKLVVYLLFFCTAISFIRIIYIILFLPLLFKSKKEFQFDFRFLKYFILWLVFSTALFVLNNLFVSPYPDSYLQELFATHGLVNFIANFLNHFMQNVVNLINPFSDQIIQVLLRYFVIITCIYSLIASKIIQRRFKSFEIEYFIVFLILFLLLAINIAAYDVFDWRDYRVMSPVAFGCILFLILSNKRSAIYFSLAINLIGIVFLIFSPNVTESFTKDRYRKLNENKMLNRIDYKVNPISRFENTIVIQQFDKDVILNIPAGIGISYSSILSDKLKSNYIYSKKQQALMTYKLVDSNESGYLYKKKKKE